MHPMVPWFRGFKGTARNSDICGASFGKGALQWWCPQMLHLCKVKAIEGATGKCWTYAGTSSAEPYEAMGSCNFFRFEAFGVASQPRAQPQVLASETTDASYQERSRAPGDHGTSAETLDAGPARTDWLGS